MNNQYETYTLQSRLMLADNRLYETHKLMLGEDYIYAVKSGKVHFLCTAAQMDKVKAVCTQYAIEVETLVAFKD